jgi:hypothetical protein
MADIFYDRPMPDIILLNFCPALYTSATSLFNYKECQAQDDTENLQARKVNATSISRDATALALRATPKKR